ncbi:hypothetical protein MAPG_09534 [Magnaporthiopsis poae ATCC 64411]|uniref:Uncharacterized protein n=1 Tax=Magnaporthiopsis poae (strain ATCC 64411 / 73-15) TaxID=644358 RepID=A0A0C4EA75_MAGP6|nr:hypothetical protein MAPG_09534 [Magnaporthiopsis poae ATCC 64411]
MSGNNSNNPIRNLADDMPGLGLYDDLTDLGDGMPFLNGGMPSLHGRVPDPNPGVQQGPGAYPGNVSHVPLRDLPLQQLQQRPLADMALFFNSLANQDPFADRDPFAQNPTGGTDLGFVPAVPSRADSASSGPAAAPGINLQEMIQQEVQQQVRAQVRQQVQQELLNMGVVQAHPPMEQFGNVAGRAEDSFPLMAIRNRAPSVATADTGSSSELSFNRFQPDFLGGLGGIPGQGLAQTIGPDSIAAFTNQGGRDVMLGAPGAEAFGDIGFQAPLDAGGFQGMDTIPTLDFNLDLNLDVDASGNLVTLGGAEAPAAALGDVGNRLGGSALPAVAADPSSARGQASMNVPVANDPPFELDDDFMAQLDDFLAGGVDPFAGDDVDDMFDNAVPPAAVHNAAGEDQEEFVPQSQGLRRSARVRERRERTPARRSASPARSHDGNDGNDDDDDEDDDNDRAASDNSDRVRYRRQMAKQVRIGPRPGADLFAYVDRVETGSCVDCGQDLSAVAGNGGICNACRTERLKFYGWRTWRRRANAHNRGADDDDDEEADRAEETWRRAPAFRLPGVTKAVYVARLGAGQCVDCGGHGRSGAPDLHGVVFRVVVNKRTSQYTRQTYLERKEKRRTASAWRQQQCWCQLQQRQRQRLDARRPRR